MSLETCDQCKKRPTIMGGHWITDGVVHSEHLCAECYGGARGLSERERARLIEPATPVEEKPKKILAAAV